VIAGLIGMLSAIFGMVVAVWLNTPPGPAMALVATFFYLMTVVLAPRRGMVAKARYRRQRRQLTEREDILKRIFRQSQGGQLPQPSLIREQLDMSMSVWNRQLKTLRSKGLVEGEALVLTDSGRLMALRLVRAHRLWETYLNQEVGLSADQIHAEAERLEHLLTDEMLERVDRELGYPTRDPHGSLIPPREEKKVNVGG
jgi:Mn-dependent DtxR family transcriptional regulator